MQIGLSSEAEAAIRAHVASAPREEVCGLLFGGNAWIARAEPAANVAAEPADSFEIDPQALFAAIRAERRGGPALIGHYHSHPHGAPEPSARDIKMALDGGRLWLIVAGDVLRLWRTTAPHCLEPVELALASDPGKGQTRLDQ